MLKNLKFFINFLVSQEVAFMCGKRKRFRKDKKRKNPNFLMNVIENGERERATLLQQIEGGILNPSKLADVKHRLKMVEASICKFMNILSPEFDEYLAI